MPHWSRHPWRIGLLGLSVFLAFAITMIVTGSGDEFFRSHDTFTTVAGGGLGLFIACGVLLLVVDVGGLRRAWGTLDPATRWFAVSVLVVGHVVAAYPVYRWLRRRLLPGEEGVAARGGERPIAALPDGLILGVGAFATIAVLRELVAAGSELQRGGMLRATSVHGLATWLLTIAACLLLYRRQFAGWFLALTIAFLQLLSRIGIRFLEAAVQVPEGSGTSRLIAILFWVALVVVLLHPRARRACGVPPRSWRPVLGAVVTAVALLALSSVLLLWDVHRLG